MLGRDSTYSCRPTHRRFQSKGSPWISQRDHWHIHPNTPREINMEPENGPDWKTIFLYTPVLLQVACGSLPGRPLWWIDEAPPRSSARPNSRSPSVGVHHVHQVLTDLQPDVRCTRTSDVPRSDPRARRAAIGSGIGSGWRARCGGGAVVGATH